MNRTHILLMSAVLFASAGPSSAATYEEVFGHKPDVNPEYASLFESINYRTEPVTLSAAGATITVPKGFVYLDTKDATTFLTKIWGNPPSTAEGNLGIILPTAHAPEETAEWAAVLEYIEEGHVSDEDAATTDYGALLKEMQQGTEDANAERVKQGYEPIKLVGWATPPHYDQAHHALYWAKDLLFGTDDKAEHTLNYNVRLLNREGVLQLNFVASMGQLNEINESIPAAISMVRFNPDHEYSAYRDGDKLAAYGLAGLIAAGAGAKIAAKAGLIAIALAFLKKGGFVLVLAAGAIGKIFKNLLGAKKDPPTV